jgi:hypothetical protein
MRPVPNHAAGVHRVDQDSERSFAIATDGGSTPGAAARRRHVVAVQAGCDVARRSAGKVFGVDPAHDRRLGRVDGALADVGNSVAVGQAAGARARQRAAGETAMGLVREIVKIDFAHQSAHANVELVRLAVGIHAIADADQADAVELQTPRKQLAFRAITRKSLQVIDEHDIEQLRGGVREQATIGFAIIASAADAGIRVYNRIRPAHSRCERATVAQLVLQTGFALLVAGIACVGGDAHGQPPKCRGLVSLGSARRNPSSTRDQPMRACHSRPSITAR